MFIDLKYSGLIDDKWNEMGWDLDSLPLKDSLMVQGVHYKLLAKEAMGIEDIPFYYWVFDSSNPANMKIIRQNVDESRLSQHLLSIDNIKRKLQSNLEKGFNLYPSLKNCTNCPLKPYCGAAAEVANIDEVTY